ncbi:hypothetical protein [Pseudotabrizicola sp. 4114]|uniref:hypothetical protein n=1 Tax=Pseudotabrizicola sp. 4114 TaxID=2817731 RepID=UPI0028617602|nr:hypothetical protein [Pseudorhodobacter sp. 4114]
MLFKIILIFLLAMVLVGMVGKLVFPSAIDRMKNKALGRGPVCRSCGRYIIGKSCDCGKKG